MLAYEVFSRRHISKMFGIFCGVLRMLSLYRSLCTTITRVLSLCLPDNPYVLTGVRVIGF